MSSILKLRFFWKSGLVLITILYLSFTSPSAFRGIPVFVGIDKVIHVFMYLGLTLSLINDSMCLRKIKDELFLVFLFCFSFPIVLGGIIEILQPVLATRTASFSDWFADIVGVFLGFLVANLFKTFLSKTKA